VTSSAPTDWAGEAVVIWVGETTENPLTGTVPNKTALAPRNPVPVMVTAVAPVAGPATGLTTLTVGAASKLNWSKGLVALVPLGVVTVTFTGPAAPAGEKAVIWVAVLTV
jgi:hypothetical protein